jgi:sugar phosphate isomerase/epimerase
MSLAPRALVLTQGSAAYAPFPEHVAVAAATGCAGVSVWASEIERAQASGLSLAQMRRILDEHGLICNDVDALVLWAGSGDPAHAWLRPAPSGPLLEAGHALGAPYANCVISADAGYARERAAAAFARAAEQAESAGMRLYLEFVPAPISAVSDLAEAFAVVEASGAARAGVLIDTWHFFRGGSTLADLRAVPGERLLGLQINDAPALAEADLAAETMHRRLLPGEGDIPLASILRALDAQGSPAPCTIEVFSDALRALGPIEAARRAVDATRRVLARRPA